MKTVEVNIKGNSLLAYVTFYDEDILSKLNEIDEGEYDFIDFSSEHEKGGAFLGRGFCEDGNLNLNVSVDSKEQFNGGLYYIDDEYCPADEIEQLFQDDYGEDGDCGDFITDSELFQAIKTYEEEEKAEEVIATVAAAPSWPLPAGCEVHHDGAMYEAPRGLNNLLEPLPTAEMKEIDNRDI